MRPYIVQSAWTYTLRDVAGGLWGTAVFALAMFAPGYCVARWTNLCDFRRRGLREQMAWSMVLSLGVGTIALVALVWIAGVVAAGWLLLALGLIAAVMFWRDRPSGDLSRRQKLLFAAVFVMWSIVVILSLVDWPHGSGLAMSVTSYDHSVRTAMVGTVMRTGVVPANPLYWPGHAAALRYYYFWYVTCGVVARLAHITARQALIASCVWPMFSVAALLALYGRYLLNWRGDLLRRRWWMSVALMSVTGLDLLMVLLGLSAGGTPAGDMEWWSIDQVTSWADTFLWVPHHAAAMVCCMLCLLLLWMASTEPHTSERAKLAVLAGLCFASSFGLSSYVGAAMAIVAVVWLVWRMFSPDRMRAFVACAIGGLVAVAVLGPYLAQLLHHTGADTQGAGSVLAFDVRMMLTPDLLMGTSWLKGVAVNHPVAAHQIAASLLLVPGYLIELGLFGIVLLIAWRQRKSASSGESTLRMWTVAGLICATVLRSHVIDTNDFGPRASLLVQFCLLLLGVLVLERCSRGTKLWLLGLALIGLAGTVYQVITLRISLPEQEARRVPEVGGELQRQNYVFRDVWAAADSQIPLDARVQYNIVDKDYVLGAEMIQARRQLVSGDDGCDVAFGGDPAACPAIQEGIEQLFQSTELDAGEARQACAAMGANYLVVTRWDPAWAAHDDWVWNLPAVVERPEARLVTCAHPTR